MACVHRRKSSGSKSRSARSSSCSECVAPCRSLFSFDTLTPALFLLLQTTLTTRANVDIVLEQRAHSVPQHAQLLLAYKFSESISRRGVFTLPLVAQAIPLQVVELLTALHATPSEPVPTDAQKLARDVATRPTISAAELAARVLGASASTTPAYPLSSNRTSATLTQTTASASTSADAGASATTSALKRRLVPCGAMYVCIMIYCTVHTHVVADTVSSQ